MTDQGIRAVEHFSQWGAAREGFLEEVSTNWNPNKS